MIFPPCFYHLHQKEYLNLGQQDVWQMHMYQWIPDITTRNQVWFMCVCVFCKLVLRTTGYQRYIYIYVLKTGSAGYDMGTGVHRPGVHPVDARSSWRWALQTALVLRIGDARPRCTCARSSQLAWDTRDIITRHHETSIAVQMNAKANMLNRAPCLLCCQCVTCVFCK